MNRHVESNQFTEKNFKEVKYKFWFPDIPDDIARLIRQAHHLDSNSFTLSFMNGDMDLESFAHTHAQRIRLRAISWVGEHTESAVGFGDSVLIDEKNPMMIVSSHTAESDTFRHMQMGTAGLWNIMTEYFAAKQAQKFILFRGGLSPRDEADNWMDNEFFPWVAAYVDNVVNVSSDDGHADAQAVIDSAKSFLCSLGAQSGVEIRMGNSVMYYQRGTLLADRRIGNVLAEAYDRGGTINGMPAQSIYIPWELFPIENI